MHWIDWLIVTAVVGTIAGLAITTRRYMSSVADFLSASRCAGKYLLGVADGVAMLGAVSIVAVFEMTYKAGFTASWWGLMLLPIGLFVSITGWVQYRFRQTRAMTMAQFFEIRYNRSFRIFAGMVGCLSGILNFGIFPAVGGRFFQYFCGLPTYEIELLGMRIDLVYGAIMAVLLLVSLTFTLMGGQIAVMVTDFVQGVFVNVVFVIMGVYLLFFLFDWNQIVDAAIRFAPPDASLINPMKTSQTDNFNLTYFLIMAFATVYGHMAWQGNQGYYSAARSPHDARMGRVVGGLRNITQTLPLALLPVCAFTFLHHPDFSDQAREAHAVLESIGSDQIRSQLTVTVASAHFLAPGFLGLFAAVMLAAFISTHDTYLHSWGSIFIQDVILPIRQMIKGDTIINPRAHIRWLKLSAGGVCLFIFLFSLLFNQKQDIFMFFALTGMSYMSWAGCAIIGGLYWKRGTAGGVWAAGICGIGLAFGSWFLIYQWQTAQTFVAMNYPDWWETWTKLWPDLSGPKCPLSAKVLYFWTTLATIAVYVTVSLMQGQTFDMDRLLHRGKYAVEEPPTIDSGHGSKSRVFGSILNALGFGRQFSISDRILFFGYYLFALGFFALFLIGSVSMLSVDIPDTAWGEFWWWFCLAMLAATVAITVWVSVGGVRDLRDLFRLLRTVKRDEHDDGTVVGHESLVDRYRAEDR